jgi:hypothetical protein
MLAHANSPKAAAIRSHSAKAAAIRICWEVYRLHAGRVRRWHEVDAIEERLGIRAKVTQAAYRFASDNRWVVAVGDPVSSVMLLEAGRQTVEAEES